MTTHVAPDPTAIRTALWRALHVEVDAPPHVIDDTIGLALASPDPGWRSRPDMDPDATRLFRASIVARARFMDDLVTEQSERGVGQYVILGAGLDTFAQRRPDIASRLLVFEVDRPGASEWKRARLIELGYGMPAWLKLVPVDFEAGGSWLARIEAEGFDASRPAIVACSGVSMYLSREGVTAMLRRAAALAPGSTFAMTFLLPFDRVHPELRAAFEWAAKGAQASGTAFLSVFTPPELMTMALDAGFRTADHISADQLGERYFSGRGDGLRTVPAEELLLATT